MRRSLRKILISSAPHLFCIALASGQVNASEQAAGRVDIQQTATTADSATVRIKLPANTQAKSLQVNLNGKDISSSFSSAECSGSICKQAVLTTNEGLRDSKNVLSVNAGNGITGRLRFDHSAAANSSSPMVRSMALTSGITPQNTTITGPVPFLPPTLTFKTNYNGGWDNSNAWFTIGNQAYPDTTKSITGCPSVYVVVVLDRLALNQTDAQCFGDPTSLKTYLQKLTAADLVVVGTMKQQQAANLDLTPIGGTDHTSDSNLGGIMAIGAGGASPGSAYESYFDFNTTKEIVTPFANGTLQEDAYGFYDFQSSEVREFTVSPNDPAYLTPNTISAISISAPAGSPNKFFVYTPPSGANGYWLLTLSRYSLNTYPYGCAQSGGSSDGSIVYVTNCGTFYNTGSSNPATSKAAYLQLATDIAGVTSNQLGFLTTVGQAAYGGSNNSIWNVGGFNGSYTSPSNGFLEFSNALEAVGGTPGLTEQLLSPTSAYTYIFSPGMGGPLTGTSVESSTVLAAQGQSGLVHGILQRNLNGLFTPQQTDQETNQSFQSKGGLNSPEFVLQEAAMQQPVDWPSSSQTTLLQGASSIQGQVAAYQYLSYVLLTKIYIPGMTGSHLDDIHYYFTGSYNTAINYHYYDVINILWPGANPTGPYVVPCQSVSGTQCSITLPNGDALQFTEGDFLAVRNQLRTEIQYLTNTLQFLVTGSNNMKDVIATGNSNVGLALTGAAAAILGSKLVPVTNQPTVVHHSWQNIVSMIGGVASIGSAIPGLGEALGFASLGTNIAKAIGGTSGVVGGLAGMAAGAGQITSKSASSTLPSAFSKFAINIGDLANENLQDQLSAGFDTTADSLTSDWGRLSLIGPMVIDSNNSVFFSPNQVAQNAAVQIMTQAASRSFYLDLMPNFYYVHYWEGVAGDATNAQNNTPDMGFWYKVGTVNPTYYCKAYYLSPNENTQYPPPSVIGKIPANTSIYYPSPGGTSYQFQYDFSYWAINYYVIAGSTTAPGSDHPFISVLDQNLASNLFTPSGLNLPIDEFVTKNGPMSAVWIDAAGKNPAGESTDSVCNANVYMSENPAGNEYYPSDVSSPSQPVGGLKDAPTITSLTAPASITAGDQVTLQATVVSGGNPVVSGQIFFIEDGTIVSTVPLDKTGNASVTWQNVAVGQHTLQASYSRADGYQPSSSSPATLQVYTGRPALDLSLSSTSIQASYGGTSAPVALQLTSMAGLAGTVNLSCTGLPVGMTCNFNPSQLQLSAGGVGAVTLTITGTVQQASMLPMAHGFALVFGPLLILFVWRMRGNKSVPVLFTMIVLSALTITGLSGCSVSNSSFKESGTKTIMVNATVGKVTVSQPLVINIQ